MVRGLQIFKSYFADFEDCYLIIGGTACDVILEEAGLTPRATNDIDIILIIEAITPDFVKKFWEFIREGNYQIKQKETEKRNSYRFLEPLNSDFPVQLELFSQVPDLIDLADEAHLTPIPTGEGLSNLSAILLDKEYYRYTLENSIKSNGIHYADIHTLICLKAFAFLSNTALKAEGKPIQNVNIVKHKNDVFRLVMMLPGDQEYTTPEIIHNHLQEFANAVAISLPSPLILKSNGFGNLDMKEVFATFCLAFQLQNPIR